MKQVIYMDNNATTQVAPEVVEEMTPYFHDLYGNPSSMHTFGGQVKTRVAAARERVADFLGALPDEIVFTSCGTESDNAAVLGTLETRPDKKHFITTRVEHPAIWNLRLYLRNRGYRVTGLSVDRKGMLDPEELREALDDDTALVSVMYANNETGVVFPVEELARMVTARGIPFHTDAVQAAGKIPLDMSGSAVDLLSISGHKLHAPKGIGVLYIRRGTKFSPFLKGGHQEKGRRGGRKTCPTSWDWERPWSCPRPA
jgi:cysteine desulfurase